MPSTPGVRHQQGPSLPVPALPRELSKGSEGLRRRGRVEARKVGPPPAEAAPHRVGEGALGPKQPAELTGLPPAPRRVPPDLRALSGEPSGGQSLLQGLPRSLV